jgi:hypothetical protein
MVRRIWMSSLVIFSVKPVIALLETKPRFSPDSLLALSRPAGAGL